MAVAIQVLETFEAVYVPRGSEITKRQGKALRALRARSRLTQEQVADAIPMKVDTYRGYEKGYTELKLGQLEQFASALQVSVAALMQQTGLMTLNAREIHLNDVADIAERLGGIPEADADFVVRNAQQLIEFARRRDRESNN